MTAQETGMPDAQARIDALQRIAQKSGRVVELWLNNGSASNTGSLPASAGLAGDFLELTQRLLADPAALVALS